MNLEIEWDTEDDRRRRRYKASTIHGWLCMWRGTLAGNEAVRQRGRREMKEARAIREYYRQRAAEKAKAAGGSSGPLGLFRFASFKGKARAAAPASRPKAQRHKSSSSRRSGHDKAKASSRPAGPARHKSSGAQSGHSRRAAARPEPTRHRSTHSSRSRPSTSRRSSARP
ncbi:hypothetical protein BC834DRAFT_969798 [Gloeopeniophorella convolvens]|nr:hypothetical protein BC834DRAFT_969798 [Gloeopeniophorella convolvens]